jgi:alpha-ribazole phosphatase
MTKLILIRHGETDYNLQNRYCGFSNPSLNKNGIWQSRKLADRFSNIKVEKIYSSDLKRAIETAKIIFKKNSIEQLPGFREMNFGIFEGLKYDEIVKKYPSLYKDWIDNPIRIKLPNGEALEDLVERVRKRLTFLLSQHKDGEIALVTHGGPIRVILCDALKFNLASFWKIKQDIAAINLIDYPEGSSPTVVKINDISHLTMQEVATA